MEGIGREPRLTTETARRLASALSGIDCRKAEFITVAHGADDEAVRAAADRYLDARDEMAETMADVAGELQKEGQS